MYDLNKSSDLHLSLLSIYQNENMDRIQMVDRWNIRYLIAFLQFNTNI
jgi:hypothetical protein